VNIKAPVEPIPVKPKLTCAVYRISGECQIGRLDRHLSCVPNVLLAYVLQNHRVGVNEDDVVIGELFF